MIPEEHLKHEESLPEVTLSAFTETGQAESHILVPKQRSYIGRYPVIPSSLMNTRCTDLGAEGVLDKLNTTLSTAYTLDAPCLSSLLKTISPRITTLHCIRLSPANMVQ
ncbi:uncharacterized protein ARMOST_11394 [Armillaria ostoyae]|uniref:Uncharacterized protein n=1 Tax=Armillaria ostoyae TaxID=47428 RepID=A0A284RGZ6_ARMOS|nr:uncharacterized protein ARMOST_11394 [Armillaria ostoyae]